MADSKIGKQEQAELDALADMEAEMGEGELPLADVLPDEEDEEPTPPKAAKPAATPKPAAKPKPTADGDAKPERVKYDRKNTAGKVIQVLREDYLEGRKESYRTKFTWPSLVEGMTVEQWHKATQALSEAKTGAKGEGVPNIFLTELVANGFIAFEDAPAA